MRDLSTRSFEPEQMDDPAIDPLVYAAVLADLSRVNRCTLTVRPTLRFLSRATRHMTSFSLLDVGFGHGDMLRAIAAWTGRRGIAAQLTGIDLNPLSRQIARAATPADPTIDFLTGDYQALAGRFDFIISSQVAHHMSMDQLRAFLRFMEDEARCGWLVSDLDRHVIAYCAFPLLARLMRVHRIVREDGTLSIARSIRADEWRPILEDAGIARDGVRIRRHIPFRLSVERLRG